MTRKEEILASAIAHFLLQAHKNWHISEINIERFIVEMFVFLHAAFELYLIESAKPAQRVCCDVLFFGVISCAMLVSGF